MNILLASALPEVSGFFGLRHHYPAGILSPGTPATPAGTTGPRPGSGMSFTEFRPGETVPGASGPVIAHLTGTSVHMLRAAEELASRSVPFVFSPMLPSAPSPFASLAGRLAASIGMKTGSMKEAELARRIAASAFRVAARNEAESACLLRTAGIPGGKILTIQAPAAPESVLRVGTEPAGTAFGNLAVAFCDSNSPEWNVMRFIFAMEKINADAVIVAGRSDTPYARDCIARAGLNPRVQFLCFEPGKAHEAAAGVSALIRRASILVDPSLRGLCGGIASGITSAGLPTVVSGWSLDASGAAAGMFTFEPSSWELLNHAITSAFNRAASLPASGGGGGIQAGPMTAKTPEMPEMPEIQARREMVEMSAAAAKRNLEISGTLEVLYAHMAAGAAGR